MPSDRNLRSMMRGFILAGLAAGLATTAASAAASAANTAARPVKNLFRLCCLMITPSLNILTAHMNSMHPS